MEPGQALDTKKVLILGDWVVDDYWVMGIHRSPTASRTGRIHYRSLHSLGSSVRALCGAGRTASVLYEARRNGSRLFDIVGIGMWHKEDDNSIIQLIEDPTPAGLNPHRLSRAETKTDLGCKVVNLANALNSDVGTTRMIRIFQNTGTRTELLERIDWELPAQYNSQEEVLTWFSQEPDLRIENNCIFENIHAVVVKDLGKGCVSSETVGWLRKMLKPEVPWFVSSKSWQPKWAKVLPSEALRLFVVPQVAAHTALKEGNVRRWLTGIGNLTGDAINCIDDLYGFLNTKENQTYIVVLPDRQQVIIRGPFKKGRGGEDFLKKDCLIQKCEEPIRLDFHVAMASVFLPALVAQFLETPGGTITQEQARAAASFTYEWMNQEVKRIAAVERSEKGLTLDLDKSDQIIEHGDWKAIEWDAESTIWNKALTERGVIERGDDLSIELSRAMTLLEGYVCLVDQRQEHIQRLIREIRRFVGAQRRRHVSFLVTAAPGTGKSKLIDALVNAEKLYSYTINVAQLPGRLSLIDEFDTVATMQAQKRNAPFLVFVDEINSRLESQYVYDLFLSVMQNGEYVRGGNRFRLAPCIWVFAGTAKPTQNNPDPATKAQDFESRLTIVPLSWDLPSTLDADQTAIAQLERVYIGVSIICDLFPDVRRVSEKILWLFYSTPKECTIRDLVNLISGFEDIQLGKVHSRNVPEKRFENFAKFKLDKWKRRPEGKFVEIVPQ